MSFDPRDTELLLAHVLKKPRERVIAHRKTQNAKRKMLNGGVEFDSKLRIPPTTMARYRRLLRRLEVGEPLPYLLGEQWFYGRPFTVTRGVLIPRPETELLIERTLELRQRPSPSRSPSPREGEKKEGVGNALIVDVGTGSGCIAVTIAAEVPHARVVAVDTSGSALRVARENARRHGVEDRIAFVRGNLLDPFLEGLPSPSNSPSRREEEKRKKVPQFCILPSAFIILANLPYLTTAEWQALPTSIRDYEPRAALDGGPDGLTYFQALFQQLRQFCVLRFAICVLEIDPRRKRALTALIQEHLPGWEASWHHDLAGHWRVLGLSSLS